MDDSLVADISEVLRKSGLSPDLLFFTGDLIFGLDPRNPADTVENQFAAGARFLDRVRAALPERPIPKSHVYIVPGNHDVNRGKITKQELEYLFSSSRTPEEVDELFDCIDHSHIQQMLRLKDYKTFLENNQYAHCITDPDRIIHSSICETDSMRLGIVGLNSAWPCGSDVHRNGKNGIRIAARKQLDRLLPAIEGCDCKIALVHHPFAWYSDNERNDMWRNVIEAKFQFCLHGHEHEIWHSRQDRHCTFAAGACYDRSDRAAGYSLVSIDLEKGHIKYWPRMYSREGGGGWVPRFVPGENYVGDCLHLAIPSGIGTANRKLSAKPLVEMKPAVKAKTRSGVPRYKLVVFDMDGTLVDMQGTEYSWAIFWRALKYPKALRQHGFQLHSSYIINYQEWCDYCTQAFQLKGATKDRLVSIVRRNCSLRGGAIEVLSTLKQAGVKLAIISGGVDLVYDTMFAKPHDEYFSDVFINRMEFDQKGVIKKIHASPYDFAGKLHGVQALCEKYRLSPHEVMFVGDAPNDAFVSGYVGKLIGVSSAGSVKLKGHAHKILAGKSLRPLIKEVLGHIPSGVQKEIT